LKAEGEALRGLEMERYSEWARRGLRGLLEEGGLDLTRFVVLCFRYPLQKDFIVRAYEDNFVGRAIHGDHRFYWLGKLVHLIPLSEPADLNWQFFTSKNHRLQFPGHLAAWLSTLLLAALSFGAILGITFGIKLMIEAGVDQNVVIVLAVALVGVDGVCAWAVEGLRFF
jgi:hypothetical protein